MKRLEELIEDVKRFNSERDWDRFHSPKNLSISLVIEAAELAEIFQWLTEEESRSPDGKMLARVEEEVGDVLIYLLNICSKLQIDPLRAAGRKLRINESRYPVEAARGRSDKYTELDRR